MLANRCNKFVLVVTSVANRRCAAYARTPDTLINTIANKNIIYMLHGYLSAMVSLLFITKFRLGTVHNSPVYERSQMHTVDIQSPNMTTPHQPRFYELIADLWDK
ncbi:hypothetical protein PMIN02_006944 [Paraphaeosphaeria minitans]